MCNFHVWGENQVLVKLCKKAHGTIKHHCKTVKAEHVSIHEDPKNEPCSWCKEKLCDEIITFSDLQVAANKYGGLKNQKEMFKTYRGYDMKDEET